MKKIIFSRQCDADKDIIPLWYYWYTNVYKADKIVILAITVKGSTTIDWVKDFYKDKNVDIFEKEFIQWFATDVYNHQHSIIKDYISKEGGDYTVLYVDSDEFFEPVPNEIYKNREYLSYTQIRLATLSEITLENLEETPIYNILSGNKYLVDPHSEPRTLYINNYNISKYPLVQRINNMVPSGFYYYHFHFRGLEWCINKFKNMKYIPNAPGSSFHWKKYTKILNTQTQEEINLEYDQLKKALVETKDSSQFKSFFKKINVEFSGEFGYELLGVIPYAYFLYKNKMLGKTKAKKDMEPYYYFSKKHEILKGKRVWQDLSKFPVKTPHFKDIPAESWEMPPYKDIYKNNEIIFDKPIYIIANKYSVEWLSVGKPVNFIDLETLEKLFQKLQDDYQVVYCRATNKDIIEDCGKIHEFSDFDLVDKFPKIKTIQQIYNNSKQDSFNKLQLMLFANAEKFITVQGGYAVLGSLFEKQNIIFAKQGFEVEGDLYNKWYSKLSNSKIIHVKTMENLLNAL